MQKKSPKNLHGSPSSLLQKTNCTSSEIQEARQRMSETKSLTIPGAHTGVGHIQVYLE